MSTASATRPRGIKLPRQVGRYPVGTIVAAAGITIAILLPFFYDSGSAFIEDTTTAFAYVVMALGLNIVV